MTEVLTEKINVKAASFIVNSYAFEDYFSTFDGAKTEAKKNYDKIINYCKTMLKLNGQNIVKYEFVAGRKDGRLFAKNGIQSVQRNIRGLLCAGLTTDIDQVNSHPTILSYICNRHDIACPTLDDYILNRRDRLDQICEDDNITRAKAKQKVLIATNDYKKSHSNNDWFKLYDKEVKRIQILLQSIDEYNYIKPFAKRDANFNGSFINHILTVEENKILYSMREFLQERDMEVHSLAFDGCMVYGHHYEDESLLKELELHINRNNDYKMRLDYKHHSTEIVIPDDWKSDDTHYNSTREEFQIMNSKVGALFIRQLGDEVEIYKKDAFSILHEEMTYTSGTIEKCFLSTWYADKMKLKYDKFDTYPNEKDCPANVKNMWIPFPADRHVITDTTDELKVIKLNRCRKGLAWFLHHIKVMCNHHELSHAFVMMWIAQMIQFPHIKSIELVFISDEGAGKGCFLEFFKTMMGGPKKVWECTNPQRDIFGPFNAGLKQSFLVIMNEANKSCFYNANDQKKALITDDTININIKQVCGFVMRSCHRFIIFTNNEDPITVSKKGRREFIARCSDEKIDDDEYFIEGWDYAVDLDVCTFIYNYFKELPNIPKKITKNDIPITEHHETMIENSKSSVELFIEEFVMDADKAEIKIAGDDLFKKYKTFCHEGNYTNIFQQQSFLQKIMYMKIEGISKGFLWVNGKSKRGYEFDIKLIKAALKIVDIPKEQCLIPTEFYNY